MNDLDIVVQTEHFTREELSCNCGCGLCGLRRGFAEKLEFAREKAGCAFIIRSSRRCDAHNTREGGSGNSEHIWGDGIDVETKDGYTRWKVVTSALAAGIRRIGIGSDFVHLGDGLEYKPFPVFWNYTAVAKAPAKESEG